MFKHSKNKYSMSVPRNKIDKSTDDTIIKKFNLPIIFKMWKCLCTCIVTINNFKEQET